MPDLLEVNSLDESGSTDANGNAPAQQLLAEAAAGGPISTTPCTVLGTSSTVLASVVVDPRGSPTTHRFNANGYLIAQTDALGQTTTFERENGTNLLLSTTDPLSRVTSFTYDANGNVTSITDPAGNVRSFTYEPTFNRLTSVTDPLNNVTQFAYDPNGNLTTITDPLNNATQIAYNQFGQPISTTDPLTNITTFTYDTVGNLTEIADSLGNTTTRTYDAVSRLIEQTDPRGNTTEFFYDDLNRITQIVDALNRVTTFNYDGNGNLLTVTDARGNTTTHTYDTMDRLATRTDPLNRSESFTYDPDGNLTQFTDRTGQISSSTYDPLSRRTRSDFDGGTFTEFTFDAVGRVVRATDSQTGTIVDEYDVLDRLVRETTPQGTISYAYDALGRRTTMTVEGQAPVAYTYDATSRLRTITQVPLAPLDIQYDALGRRTLLTLPNGVSTEYQYDTASRLTALIYRNAIGVLGDLRYEYDPAGNRTAAGGSFARTLLPDPISSATYDGANQQLAFGDKTMTFDPNGNLETISDLTGTTTFTWDSRNRLVDISGPTVTASFQYDALGRRIEKVINGQTTDFHYDQLDIIREIAGGTEVAYLRSLNIDEPLTRTDTNSTTLLDYVADAVGNTVALTDPSGALLTTYTYEPFGQTARAGDPSPNAFQYTARENDGIGLYHYRERYYSAEQMRFISKDIWDLAYMQVWMRKQLLLLRAGSEVFGIPLGDVIRRAYLFNPSLHNSYAYAGNNPLRFSDPLGLFFIDIGLNIPVFGLFGGLSIDAQIQVDRNLNLEQLNLVPGVYVGLPGVQVLGVTGDPTPGFQGTISGGYYVGGSATLCGNGPMQSICSAGAGFSTPGVAVEIIQYGFEIYKRK